MMGKSLRKIGTEKTGKAAQENLLLDSSQFPPSRSIQQDTRDSQSHLRHAPASLVLKSYQPWSRRDVPSRVP
jgi:hypothetical protein